MWRGASSLRGPGLPWLCTPPTTSRKPAIRICHSEFMTVHLFTRILARLHIAIQRTLRGTSHNCGCTKKVALEFPSTPCCLCMSTNASFEAINGELVHHQAHESDVAAVSWCLEVPRLLVLSTGMTSSLGITAVSAGCSLAGMPSRCRKTLLPAQMADRWCCPKRPGRLSRSSCQAPAR